MIFPRTFALGVARCALAMTAVLAMAMSLNSIAHAHDAPRVWVTWKGIEPDKGASAWYLRKFVRPDVQFREVRAGSLELGDGEAFDVPQAPLRRTHKHSVYEQLASRYPVDDPTARRIGELIHDIEINLWRPKKYSESTIIETAAMDHARRSKDSWIPLDCYIEWFESIYQKMRTEPALSAAPNFPANCFEKS